MAHTPGRFHLRVIGVVFAARDEAGDRLRIATIATEATAHERNDAFLPVRDTPQQCPKLGAERTERWLDGVDVLRLVLVDARRLWFGAVEAAVLMALT
jgi:hypothetical protein